MKLNESEAEDVDASYKKTRRTSLPKIKFEESKHYDQDLSNVKYDYRGVQSSRVIESNKMSESAEHMDDEIEFKNDPDLVRKQSNTVIE